MAAKQPRAYEFGAFRLDCTQRKLSWGGREVPLTGKGLDLLAALLRANGEPLTKQQLMAEVWSDSFVEENNLTVTMSALRKALGEEPGQNRFIETLPRRGYRFVPPTREIEVSEHTNARRRLPNVLAPANAELAARHGIAGRAAFRPSARAMGGERSLVGRKPELARLSHLLAAAMASSGSVAFITGDAGSGKTALTHAFIRSALESAPDLLAATGRCVEHFGAGEALAPFLHAVADLISGDAAEALVPLLEAHAPTWCLQFPERFSESETLGHLRQITVGSTQARMLRELCHFLKAVARLSPVLLSIEDLHWADPASVDALRLLGDMSKSERLLVVGTLRLEALELHNRPLHCLYLDLHSDTRSSELKLGGLSVDDIQTLLACTFQPHEFSAELSAFITSKTEGQPLFVTRLLQHLVERGDIRCVAGRWHLARELRQLSVGVPESIRSLIERKLHSLTLRQRRMLQFASVQGDEFTSLVLSGLLGADEVKVQERLRHLERVHHLVVEQREEALSGHHFTLRYRFTHALYQNVLYAELVAGRRRQLHLAAAECLIAHTREYGLSFAAQIAWHSEEARDFGRAAEYRIQCGDRAVRAYAFRAAIEHYSHAIALLERVRTPGNQLRAIALHKLAWARIHLLDFAPAVAELKAALEGARAIGDQQLEGETLNALCHVAVLHRHDRTVSSETARQALELAAASGQAGVGLVARALLAGRSFLAGDSISSEPELSRVVADARRFEHYPALVLGLGFLGLLRFWRSEYAQAEALLTETIAYDVDFRDSSVKISALCVAGASRSHLGRIEDALVSYEDALVWAQRAGDATRLPHVLSALSWLHHEVGQPTLGEDYARQTVQALTAESGPYGLVGAQCNLLEASLNCIPTFGARVPRLPDSEACQHSLRELARGLVQWNWWHWSFHLRVDACTCQQNLQRKEFELAERGARLLLEMASEHRARKYMAIAHRILAEVRGEAGDWDAASNHLQLGLNCLEEVSGTLWTWKLLTGAGRLARQANDHAAMLNAYSRAWALVRGIAGSMRDEKMRTSFLESSGVREVRDFANAWADG